MKSYHLQEKDETILKLIVENYLMNGTPVSSGFIAKKLASPVSPATARNIMAKLEKLGCLYQPHISAGRIPTDKGLRFYVDNLFKEAFFPFDTENLSPRDFGLQKGDFNSLLVQVSKTLSDYSDNLGFVISPRITRINFRHLRFIKISEEKVMVILVSSSNLVLTEIIETKYYFTQIELDRASQHINENFRGKNLLLIRDYLQKDIPISQIRYDAVIQKLISLLKIYFNQEDIENKIVIQGASKLLEKPEFSDLEKLKSLFQNIEEKARLAKLLSEFISLDRVKVLIGEELSLPDISECSLILSHYGYDRQILGSLGIIGPKRIPYKKIIPIVDNIAHRLSQTISFNQ